MQSLKIDAARLGEEPEDRQLTLDAGWIAHELDGVTHTDGEGEGEVSLSLARIGGKVQVSGRLSARFTVPCGRCLEPAVVTHDEPFFMVYEAADTARALPEELELSDDDLHWEAFDGQEIDLGPLLREQLILAVPMTPLCSPECPGLVDGDAPYPDGDPDPDEKPMDPRWNALAKLKRPG